MYTVLIVVHVLLAAALIAIILVQRGPGATMGAAFGSGASGTVFGSRGATGFLTKLTSWLGVAFFAVSLSMAVLVARSVGVADSAQDLGVVGQLVAPQGERPAPAEQAADAAAADDEAAEEEFPQLPAEEQAVEEKPPEPPGAD